MATVAERYARALLDLSVSENDVAGYQAELTAAAGAFRAENGLSGFLLDPRYGAQDKKKLLFDIFGGNTRQNVMNFLYLLLDRGRTAALPDIAAEFVKEADAKRNILDITVVSAAPLETEQLDAIGERFMSLFNASGVSFDVKTDKTLIGGVKVVVGDRVYDGTLKSRLSGLHALLRH